MMNAVMIDHPRKFILALGGYRKVAERLGKPTTTVYHWWSACDGKLPSHLYRAFCDLADEAGVPRPDPDLFRFLPLPPKLGTCAAP
jgi:hypothetical protein